jgi:transcriptional repressor NrdR
MRRRSPECYSATKSRRLGPETGRMLTIWPAYRIMKLPDIATGPFRSPHLGLIPVICPYCAADNDKVIDSRASDGGLVIRRRRECVVCHKRFTTYERVEKTSRLAVVKKDGRRVPFDQQKILASVQSACGKRPISEETKASLVQQVEDDVHREFDREVESAEIGRRVASRLRGIDQIAYIRFASEYYEFRTLDDFAEELTVLKSRPKDLPNQEPLFPG